MAHIFFDVKQQLVEADFVVTFFVIFADSSVVPFSTYVSSFDPTLPHILGDHFHSTHFFLVSVFFVALQLVAALLQFCVWSNDSFVFRFQARCRVSPRWRHCRFCGDEHPTE